MQSAPLLPEWATVAVLLLAAPPRPSCAAAAAAALGCSHCCCQITFFSTGACSHGHCQAFAGTTVAALFFAAALLCWCNGWGTGGGLLCVVGWGVAGAVASCWGCMKRPLELPQCHTQPHMGVQAWATWHRLRLPLVNVPGMLCWHPLLQRLHKHLPVWMCKHLV